MTNHDYLLKAFASYGVALDRIEHLLDDLRAKLHTERLYVFQTSGGGGAGGGQKRSRTLVAFASPDVALLFAQRNGLSTEGLPPRLRSLNLAGLLLAMARDPAIRTLVIVPDDAEIEPGRLPDGMHIARSAIL